MGNLAYLSEKNQGLTQVIILDTHHRQKATRSTPKHQSKTLNFGTRYIHNGGTLVS